MARDPSHVSVQLLTEAIEQAIPLMQWPISGAELKGAFIRVQTNDEALYFRVAASYPCKIDEKTGEKTYLAGGESYRLDLLSKGNPTKADAEALWSENLRPSLSSEPAIRVKKTPLGVAAAGVVAIISFALGFWLRSP